MWSRYTAAANLYPLRTKAVTAGVLALVGDLIAQKVEGSATIMLSRSLTYVGVNVFYIVPVLSFFYAANEQLIKRLAMQRGNWRTTAVQLAMHSSLSRKLGAGQRGGWGGAAPPTRIKAAL